MPPSHVIDQVAERALTCATIIFSVFYETVSFMIFLSVADTDMTLTSAAFFLLLIKWILVDSFTKEQLEDRIMSLLPSTSMIQRQRHLPPSYSVSLSGQIHL